eukprot:3758751-Rhodomonas_salina.1
MMHSRAAMCSTNLARGLTSSSTKSSTGSTASSKVSSASFSLAQAVSPCVSLRCALLCATLAALCASMDRRLGLSPHCAVCWQAPSPRAPPSTPASASTATKGSL